MSTTTPLLQQDDSDSGEETTEDLHVSYRMAEPKSLFAVKKSIYALTFLSALGGFLFGYDTGVVSGAMLLIEDDPSINTNTEWTELIVSATVGAAWLFALIGGPCNEYFGRKPTILFARYNTYKARPCKKKQCIYQR